MTSRRRFAAGFAALVALTGTLVFGGAISAQADAVINFGGATPAQGSTTVWTPTAYVLEGTTTNIDYFDTIDVVDWSSGSPVPLCTALDPQTGAWSCATTLEAGFKDIRVTQGSLPNTDTRTFTLNPPAPTIDQGDPIVVPFGERFTVSGTNAPTGSYVQANVVGSNAPTCPSDAPVSSGAWSCELLLDDDPIAGTFTLQVYHQAQGASSAVTERTFIVGEPPPGAVTVSNPTDSQAYTWDAGTFATIDGRAPVGAPVDIQIDGVPVAACTGLTVDAFGDWSCGSRNLEIGPHSITAIQGVESDTTLVDVWAPAPEPGGLPLSGDFGGPAYVGGSYALDGYTVFVTLYDGEVEITSCEDDTPAFGTWSCNLDLTGVAEGTGYAVEVLQRPNPENNAIFSRTGAYTYAVTDPTDSLYITSPVDADEFEWTPDGITITGTTPTPGTPVTVYFEGEVIACFDNAPTTTWACDIDELDPGEYSIIAEQGSVLSNTVGFTALLPTPDVDDSTLSYVVGTEFAVFQGASTYPGADVFVSVEVDDSTTLECDDTSDTDGWSCQVPIEGLPVGTYNVDIHQETELENSYSVSYVLEITAPPPPVIPTLTCGFSPNGGFTGSGAQPLDYLYLGLITDYDGDISGPGAGFFGDQGYCGGNDGVPFAAGSGFTYQDIDVCDDNSCAASGLAPGDYEARYAVNDSLIGYDYSPHSYVFRIPSTPVISNVVSTTNSVVLSGTGASGDAVRIVRPAGTSLCTTTVNGAGAWACQFPKSSTSSARVIEIDAQSGGMSAYSAARTIPVLVAPEAPQTPPVEEITLVNWVLEFGGDLKNLKPGDKFTLNVSGMPEGTEIEIWMHSTPVLIGTATGTGLPMTLNLTVPENIESGPHEIEMLGVTPLGTQYFFTSDATVIGGVEPAAPLKDEPVLDDKPGSGGTGDRTDPAAPSGISEGIAPASAIIANPASIAIAGGLALALLFLVALPTELLNSSLSSNTSRLGRAYGTVDGALTKAQDWFIKVTRSRAIAAAILTTIVAIIYGFVDPGFGFDVVSLRLVLSLAIAFFLLSFVASWISGMIIRRAWGAMGVIAMQPTIILFAIVGVIVARVLDFSPGFLVGIAIGLELLQASRTVSARAVFVQIAVVTGLALAAWGVYSVFTPGDDFVGMLVEDTMVAVTAEGLTGALIALFPLKFLDGHDLWAVSKRLWVLAFLVVATAFALLVLPTAIQGTDVADYGVWLLVFGVFGLGSLAVWLIFVRADKKAAEAEKESVDA